MLKAFYKLLSNDSELRESVIELQRDTYKTLVITMIALSLVGHFINGVLQPRNLLRVWGITLFMAVLGWIAISLSEKRIRIAQSIWLIGILIYILLAVQILGIPQLVYFCTLLPFLAVTTLGPAGGIASEAIIALVAFFLTRVPIIESFQGGDAILIVSGGLITGIIGWVAGNTLITVADWSLYGLEQARKNMEEARQHRAHLSAVLKDLDLAYYRLERANSSLISAYQQVDQAERFKGEFITHVSHEMRTPLNLIAGYSELILSSPENYGGVDLPGPYRSDINSIYTSSQHLLSVVDDIIDLSRVEVGKLILTFEWVELAGLIQEATDMMRDYLSAKKLELIIRLTDNSQWVYVDRLRIRQVLLNLLVNAARFTDRGHICITTMSDEKEVIVRVSDTGRGIAPEILPIIFDEFCTTVKPGSAWQTGSGLGLPISKKYIELHKGRIGVESTLTQGSTFWFTLPHMESISSWEKTESTSGVKYLESMRKHLSSVKNEYAVVLAAGDPRSASTLKHYLGEHTIFYTSGLEEGIEKAQELKATAIITNVSVNFLELPENLLVIQCPLPDYQKEARVVGAFEYLMKPVSTQQLLNSIKRAGRSIVRILVVDDDLDTVKLIQRMLYTYFREGNCLDAYSGLEALQVMRSTTVDLVILDISMPEMDGYQVLKEMKGDPDLAGIPVILLSGLAQDNTGPLDGTIQIGKRGGLNLGQIVQTMEAVLNVLAPSWRPFESMIPAHGEEPAE